MKRITLIMPLLLAIALPAAAMAQNSTTPPGIDTTTGQNTGFNSGTGISPASRDFVTEAAVGNMFEILSSQIALQKMDPTETAFAHKIISDHQKAAMELQSLVDSGAVPGAKIPTTLPQPYQDKLSKLSSLHGNAFRMQFRQDQITAHKDAVVLFQQYATDGANEKLKDWAAATLPILQGHLRMALALAK